MSTSSLLRQAIKDCENAHDEWHAARQRMRMAARNYAASFTPKELQVLLSVSKEQVANLRKGYSWTSVESAMKLSLMEPTDASGNSQPDTAEHSETQP